MRSSFRLAIATTVVAATAAGLVGSTGDASAAARTEKVAERGTAVQQLRTPLIFGHRGAAGYRPEHTATGYELAAQMGADYLEPDLVPTKDGHLVDRHEPNITETTDVAQHPEFAHLKTTKTIDGSTQTGWFTTDFTLKQLRTLRTIERLSEIRQHNTLYNGRDRIPTLEEDIKQTIALGKQQGRTIGIIPEIKHSTYFRSIGLPMEQRTLDILKKYGLAKANPTIPTILQSFEVANLQWMHKKAPNLTLDQLTSAKGAPADFVASGDKRTYADIVSRKGLKQVAKYAKILGPDKTQVVPWNDDKSLGTPTTLVRDAHAAGIRVVPYTFRNENTFLPTNLRNGTVESDYGKALDEDQLYFALGVDGLFTDNPDTGVLARDAWIGKGRPFTVHIPRA